MSPSQPPAHPPVEPHKRGKADTDDEINLTPMLDVVFIMLIFFIVSTSFVQEPGIRPVLPEAQTATRASGTTLLVAVSATGQIWMQKQQVALAQVRPLAEAFAAKTPGSTAVLVVDRKAPTGTVIDLMGQLRLSGIAELSIGADPVD